MPVHLSVTKSDNAHRSIHMMLIWVQKCIGVKPNVKTFPEEYRNKKLGLQDDLISQFFNIYCLRSTLTPLQITACNTANVSHIPAALCSRSAQRCTVFFQLLQSKQPLDGTEKNIHPHSVSAENCLNWGILNKNWFQQSSFQSRFPSDRAIMKHDTLSQWTCDNLLFMFFLYSLQSRLDWIIHTTWQYTMWHQQSRQNIPFMFIIILYYMILYYMICNYII